ncbi:MAG: PKD domain-containing protein [Actinobacteria bacterium]|nr:PKD domain-containing protein [Actinomycetota bacterium]
MEWDYEGDGIVDSTLGDHDRGVHVPGTYSPKIRVKDNSGVAATEWSAWTPVDTGRPDNKVVVVNNPPIAFATASPSEGPRYRADCLPSPGPRCNTLRVSFSAVGSSDPDPGQTITYSWDFGDGQFGSGVNVTHDFLFDNPTAAKPIKIYLATLTVTDNYGSSSAPFVLDITIYADDDGDGVTVEDKDCNDARAEAYPGAPDLLDDDRSTSAPGFGADTNCDGYDGVEANTVFVDTSKANTSPFNSAASCGTPAAPCRTVALALQVSGGSRNTIFLASTAALGPQVVNEKVTLRGGFAASFKDANASGNSSIAAAIETGTLRAWGLMLNGASGSTIWDLSIAGADRSAKTDSSVSYGAVLFNSPGVVMKNVSIVGGKGGKGAAGANATARRTRPRSTRAASISRGRTLARSASGCPMSPVTTAVSWGASSVGSVTAAMAVSPTPDVPLKSSTSSPGRGCRRWVVSSTVATALTRPGCPADRARRRRPRAARVVPRAAPGTAAPGATARMVREAVTERQEPAAPPSRVAPAPPTAPDGGLRRATATTARLEPRAAVAVAAAAVVVPARHCSATTIGAPAVAPVAPVAPRRRRWVPVARPAARRSACTSTTRR